MTNGTQGRRTTTPTVQALTGPSGIPLWVSAALPGSTHDITAARQLVLPEGRPHLKKVVN